MTDNIVSQLQWYAAKKRWPRGLEPLGGLLAQAAAALSEAEKREKEARSPFAIVAEWHDQQARKFKEMSQDDRSGELGKAKAAAAAKHHAGSAAAMRLQAINERQRALQSEER